MIQIQAQFLILISNYDFSLIESQETTTTSESQNSPKNLKKVMAAMRSNINNNVARVNRPREEGLVNNNQQPSPPLSASSKKRWSSLQCDHDNHHSKPWLNFRLSSTWFYLCGYDICCDIYELIMNKNEHKKRRERENTV